MSALEYISQTSDLLDVWERTSPTGAELVSLLTRLADILEKATELYLKQDPDPFDNRHPGKVYPDCPLGHLLKKIFKCTSFIDALLTDYVGVEHDESIHLVVVRLLLDLLPGIDPSVFQQNTNFLGFLVVWSERASNPLRSYSLGILSAAMANPDVSSEFREQNLCLVPLMLEQLHELSAKYFQRSNVKCYSNERPFAQFSKDFNSKDASASGDIMHSIKTKSCVDNSPSSPAKNTLFLNNKSSLSINELSNSSWSDMEPLMIGAYQVYPLTLVDEQRYILQYLASVGEYQEFLSAVFKDTEKVLKLILRYASLQEHSDVRLAFDALKCLASFLCHKKCAIEFVSKSGLELILRIHRPSLAATGVSFVLYYLSYSEDAMQRVCLLGKELVHSLVSYAMWLLECSHSSGRSHATMFFTQTFQFEPIRGLFDQFDGLRKLVNIVSTLDIVVQNFPRILPANLSHDQLSNSRQICRHVCVALKHYFESHAKARAAELRQLNSHYETSGFTNISYEDHVKTLADCLSLKSYWHPVEEFFKLDGISLLLRVIVMHFHWIYSGRIETVRACLEVLYICSVIGKVQNALCAEVSFVDFVQAQSRRVGMSIIIEAAYGSTIHDVDVQQLALNIIVSCVCRPFNSKEGSNLYENKTLMELWNCVRSSNGIMVLTKLLTVKSPVTGADGIRALACQALCGLARCNEVMQIISKLPLLTSGQLQTLMAEPVLKDKIHEHAKFVTYGRKLIELVVGTSVTARMESFLSNINKVEIVSQTVITYNENQLLDLIYHHLMQKGYSRSAMALKEEAKLETVEKERHNMMQSHNVNLPGAHHAIPSTSKLPCSSPRASSSRGSCSKMESSSRSLTLSLPSVTSTPITRIDSASKKRKLGSFQKHSSSEPNIKHMPASLQLPRHTVTLDTIVADYFRSQHAQCRKPYVTCPPFDLFKPHECPEPCNRNMIPKNVTLQITKKQISPYLWGYNGAKVNKKYLSCRFRDVNSYDNYDGENIVTCAFSNDGENIFLGAYNGEMKKYSLFTATDASTYTCHETEISNIQTLRNSDFILTSASWRRPLSKLWKTSENLEELHVLPDECYVEFSKLNGDMIIGTKHERAQIYDTSSGRLISTFVEPTLGNSYNVNKATFNYTDDLVLSDGVIWDVRRGQPIHKLDKFNRVINGVFHPNGLEIISNSEVWDMRTYKLLKTLPELEQCKIIFDNVGYVIFGAILSPFRGDDPYFKRYGYSLRAFDACDYSCIVTKDIQKKILDIALSLDDRYLAMIQTPLSVSSFENQSVCHVYEIGRSIEDDDEDRDDEPTADDEMREEAHNSDDDDSDDDSNNQGSYNGQDASDAGENNSASDEESMEEDGNASNTSSESNDNYLFAFNSP